MGYIFAASNFKGGCGKTTTVLNLGAALSAAGESVLLIDNDAQGNLTAALGYTPAEQSRTLANLLLAAIDYPEDLELHLLRTVLHTDSGLDLIPANRRLADAAARLQVMQLSQYNAVGELDRACEKVMVDKVGEIVNVSVDESVLTPDGKVDVVKLAPITFDPVNSAYHKLGEKVGNAFSDGLKLK